MIEEYYTKELDRLRAIRSVKNVIANTNYKIMNDLNMRDLFNKIPAYVLNPESLSWNENYNFEKNVGDALRVISSLMNTLLDVDQYKERESSEFCKDCNLFPDSGGKQLMFLFSHIPTLILNDEKIKYKKISRDMTNPSEDEWMYGMTRNEYQRENLFNKSKRGFRGKFPEKEAFVSYDLLFEHASMRHNEYENAEKATINEQLELLVRPMEELERSELFDYKVKMGSIYWDAKVRDEMKRNAEIKEMFSGIVNALAKKV